MSAIREEAYISEVRAAARVLWDVVHHLKKLRAEWDAEDYGNTLNDGAVGGNNEGITKAEVGPVVAATTDAIVTLFAAGHATNIANILP